LDISSAQLFAFISLLLAVSMTLVLQFIGKLAVSWQDVQRPWPLFLWLFTAALCHADYWIRMSSVVDPTVTVQFFYFELLFPGILTVATSMLLSVDLPNHQVVRPVDLLAHYERIAIPFFGSLILLLIIGQIDGVYVLVQNKWMSFTSVCRVAGILLCILLAFKRRNYPAATLGGAAAFALYLCFMLVTGYARP
jgi:hypothetical protein